ncbi:MAG: NAD-dependent epimerase/dehydratase family protein [Candidatus Thorarchaeota archaeon]
MRVLLTGAFGNIGESTLLALFSKGYDIRCFDIDTERNRKKAADLLNSGEFEIVWGSITEVEQLEPALKDVDVIIHLAAIIPPLSEVQPDLAKEINVQGMKNLISSISNQGTLPKTIFASSVSTYGPRSPDLPPVDAKTPQRPTDNYTHHKVECEKILRESSVPWTVLRLAAIPPLEMSTDMDPILFEIPREQKIEFAHTRDVGTAFANSVEADTIGKTLLIGGGSSCQLYSSEFTNKLMDAMGIGALPDNAFKKPQNPEDWYYTSWMDTEESEALLHFQSRTFDDYVEEMKQKTGAMRYVMRLLGPLIRRMIVKQSPYLKKN